MPKKFSLPLGNNFAANEDYALFALAAGLGRFLTLVAGFRPGISTPTELNDGLRPRLRFCASACAFASSSMSSLTKYIR